MENLMACRVCLATDVKLYEMCKYRLKSAYEYITRTKISSYDYLQHVCSYCGSMLNNFTAFGEKCVRSQQAMDTLMKEHTTLTTSHIKLINRHSHMLSLPYTVQHIQHFDSTVRTLNYSTITVKEENGDMKLDNIDYDNIYDYDDVEIKNDNDEDIENNDSDQKQDDSDEEPLSKKVKKKRKPKIKAHKHSPVKLRKNYKTEDGSNQNLTANDQDFPTNEDNFPKQMVDLEMDHKLVILSKQEQIEEVLSRKSSANYLNSVYKCDRCFKGFMTAATYNNHMARHDPRCGPVACPVCATRWPDARALRAHALISHERRYICKACGQTSKSGHKAREHTRWHAGATYPCQCGASFARSTSYLTHVRLRHATHVCAACGQSFIGETGLNMHRKKAHRDEKGEPELYECVGCRVQFRSTAALQRHCGLSGGGCADTLHVCVQCGDHFATTQLLKEHTDMHLKTDALRICSQCSRTFANERSLAAHVQRAHARTHAHARGHRVCEVCGYKCMSATSLVNHQRVHSGEKPHACTHCHKRFSVAQRLQIHVRTHTGERPFQCARCPKAFKHKAALNRHDRVHTGAKPYPCPQCGKRFSQSNSMKQHCAGVHMKTYIYSRANRQTQIQSDTLNT